MHPTHQSVGRIYLNLLIPGRVFYLYFLREHYITVQLIMKVSSADASHEINFSSKMYRENKASVLIIISTINVKWIFLIYYLNSF